MNSQKKSFFLWSCKNSITISQSSYEIINCDQDNENKCNHNITKEKKLTMFKSVNVLTYALAVSRRNLHKSL